MKTSRALTLSLITALVLAGSAFAAGKASEQDDLVRLEVARDRVANGSQSVKPGQAARLRGEAAKLQDLIDDVEAGKPVSADEIDRAINRSYNGF